MLRYYKRHAIIFLGIYYIDTHVNVPQIYHRFDQPEILVLVIVVLCLFFVFAALLSISFSLNVSTQVLHINCIKEQSVWIFYAIIIVALYFHIPSGSVWAYLLSLALLLFASMVLSKAGSQIIKRSDR